MRPDSTLEGLAALPPSFGKDGSVTAGNASGIVDGAAAVVVTTAANAAAKKRKPLGRLVSWGVVGVEPELMGLGPVPAARLALAAGGPLEGRHRPLGDQRGLRRTDPRRRPRARARHARSSTSTAARSPWAIRWPRAAPGCTLTLLKEMRRRGVRYGLAGACIGGGQGIAVVVESAPRPSLDAVERRCSRRPRCCSPSGRPRQNLVADGGFATSLEAWHHDPNTRGTSAWSSNMTRSTRLRPDRPSWLAPRPKTASWSCCWSSACRWPRARHTCSRHNARFADGTDDDRLGRDRRSTWFSGPVCTRTAFRAKCDSDFEDDASGVVDRRRPTPSPRPPVRFSALRRGRQSTRSRPAASLRVFVDDVSFAPAGSRDRRRRGAGLPVVGSLPGNFGAFFRTSLKILNPSTTPI